MPLQLRDDDDRSDDDRAAGDRHWTPRRRATDLMVDASRRAYPFAMYEQLTPQMETAPPPRQTPNLTKVMQFVVVAARRHFGKGLAVAVAIVLLVAAYLMFAPRTYLSTAKLFVRLGRESVTLEPTAQMGETMQVAESRESQLNSVLEIINGENIFDEVAARLTPDVVLGLAPIPETVPESPANADRGSAAHRKAVELLQKSIDVEAVKRSNIIWCAAESSDPLLAQRVLETYIHVAEEVYLQNTRPTGSLELFASRGKELEKEYKRRTDLLAAAKSRAGVSSLVDRRKTLQEQLSSLEMQIADRSTALAEAEAAAAGLSEALRDTEQYETASTSNMPQDARGQAETSLAKLRIELSELESQYTDRHPKVRRVRDQIARAESIVNDAEPPEQKTDSISPIWRSLETQRQNMAVKIKSLNSELSALGTASQDVQLRLRELNEAEGEIAVGEELVSVIRKARGEIEEKYEQAQMDVIMAERRLSNLTVSQTPTFRPKAIAPKRRLVAAAGLLFAIFSAIAVVLAAEYWDRSRDTWLAALTDHDRQTERVPMMV